MASSFYDEGLLRRAALNLFNGWGYNFYRNENQLRADDQLVRSKADWLLGTTRSIVGAAEAAYRREFFGTPSRAQPFPDPSVVKGAQNLERLAGSIGALGGRLQSQPVPENDRMTQRFRREDDTLKALLNCDERLVGQCALLHSTVELRGGRMDAGPSQRTGRRAGGDPADFAQTRSGTARPHRVVPDPVVPMTASTQPIEP